MEQDWFFLENKMYIFVEEKAEAKSIEYKMLVYHLKQQYVAASANKNRKDSH